MFEGDLARREGAVILRLHWGNAHSSFASRSLFVAYGVFACLCFGVQWGCVVYLFPSNNGMGGKTRRQQQEWARKVVNLFRERGLDEAWHPILCFVAKVMGAYPTPPPKPGLQYPGLYPECVPRTLDFAMFPH